MKTNEVIMRDGALFRIVQIFGNDALLIRMNGQSVDLVHCDAMDLDREVIDGRATIELDPWADVAFRTGSPSMIETAARSYAKIESIVTNPHVYAPGGRLELVKAAAKGDPAEERRIKLLLGTFWRRGQHVLSLMPDFGKNKGFCTGGKKRGRRTASGEPSGCALSAELLRVMDESIRAYIESGRKESLRSVYSSMVEQWMNECKSDSVLETVSDRHAPSYHQFYYYYRTRYGTRSSQSREAADVEYDDSSMQ